MVSARLAEWSLPPQRTQDPEGRARSVSYQLLGLGTVVLTLAYAVPQPVRLWRTRNAAGISLAALTCSCVSTVAWLSYAVHVGDGWVFASSAVYVPCLLATVWLAARHGADGGAAWLPLVFGGVLTAALLLDLASGVAVFAVVLGMSTLWRVGPSAWAAWRTRDVSGISPVTWWMALLYGSVFLAYGLSADVLATSVNALVCLAGAALVLARLAFDRYPLPGSAGLERRWAEAAA